MIGTRLRRWSSPWADPVASERGYISDSQPMKPDFTYRIVFAPHQRQRHASSGAAMSFVVRWPCIRPAEPIYSGNHASAYFKADK